MRIQSWSAQYTQLAQRHSTLWLKVISDGRDLYLVDVSTGEMFEYSRCEVRRGILVILEPLVLGLPTREDALAFWCIGGDLWSRRGGSESPGAIYKSVDGVPWEIHRIEDSEAWTAAREAYLGELAR